MTRDDFVCGALRARSASNNFNHFNRSVHVEIDCSFFKSLASLTHSLAVKMRNDARTTNSIMTKT